MPVYSQMTKFDYGWSVVRMGAVFAFVARWGKKPTTNFQMIEIKYAYMNTWEEGAAERRPAAEAAAEVADALG